MRYPQRCIFTYSITGTDLEVCSTNREQCCTDRYITTVKDVAENDILINGLNLEINETSSAFNSIVGRIKTCKLILAKELVCISYHIVENFRMELIFVYFVCSIPLNMRK
jgi:hypothetical protein